MTDGYGATTQHSVLVIDDEPGICAAVQTFLRRAGYRAQVATSAQEALRLMKADRFDMAIVDYRLPGRLQGHELIRELRAVSPATIFVAMTAYGSVEVATRMLGQGAAAYFQKPIVDQARFKRQIHELLQRREIEGMAPVVDDQLLLDHPAFYKLLGTSPAMQRLKRDILYYAPFDTNILILGESGSGKGVVAEAIHLASGRARGAFGNVNISAMTKNLVESTLFGYEKGSHDKAHETRPGLFEAHTGGTLFLDEIGDLAMDVQNRLLKTVDEQEVWRVGATRAIPIDTRILAATHVDLKAAVREKRFRQDLLYRLNAIEVRVPALRERLEDVPLLAWRRIQECNKRFKRSIDQVDTDALDFLQGQSWSENNVRHLYTVIDRAIMRSRPGTERLTVADLMDAAPDLPTTTTVAPFASATASRPAPSPVGSPESASAPPPGLDPDIFEQSWSEARKAAAEWFKREFVLQALRRHDNNITQAAKAVSVNRSNFHRMMRDTGVDLSDKRHQRLQRRSHQDDESGD